MFSSFGSAASVPAAAAPAELGRPWKYFAFVNVWPNSFEPTTLPFTFSSEPFALSAKPSCATPVTANGYTIPSNTVNTTIINTAGSN